MSGFLRAVGLLYFADWIRFYVQKCKNRKANREFHLKHPDVSLPPDYLIYESFQLNYKKFYEDSRETASWLAACFSRHTALNNKRILDWGCGPGRVIRHLPEAVGDDCMYYGTDQNKKSIDWCAAHIPNVSFNQNTISPTLPYEDGFMDIIYGISIFTHLSEQSHYSWCRELYRILNGKGVMLLTTQGDNFKVKLTKAELKRYNSGRIVQRGGVRYGHRTYSTFQPPAFMKRLFQDVTILEHIVYSPQGKQYLPQDVWIVQKGKLAI